MVDMQIRSRGISSPRLLGAFRHVPRECFVPSDLIEHAYDDQPLSIGLEQSISQPYVVAYMTNTLNVKDTDVVLEIGTGSGYQTAILAEIAKKVYTIERIDRLAESAKNLLARMGYKNIEYRVGDGSKGWPEAAPFDKIILTASPTTIPNALIEQLKLHGLLIGPSGPSYAQRLTLIEKIEKGIEHSDLFPVRFVPLVGE